MPLINGMSDMHDIALDMNLLALLGFVRFVGN